MIECFNKICRFKTEENKCEGAPVPPSECRLHKTDPSAVVPMEKVTVCASCRKECTQEELHEVKGTTTLSNHTMTFEVCNDCDPQNVPINKPT